MPGPDLRINTRPMGAVPMGVPIVNSGAPVVIPSMPNAMQGNAPTMPVAQQAGRQVDYAALRGFANQSTQTMNCKGCSPDGPSLRDIAPPSIFAKAPMWIKIVGGLSGLGIVIWAIVHFTRAR